MSSEVCKGLRIGHFNYAKKMIGVQIGAINVCHTLHGIQIGAINIHTGAKYFKFAPVLLAAF